MEAKQQPTESALQPAQEERKYKRAAQYVSDAIWAIHPSALATILEIIAERRAGHTPSAEEIRDRVGASDPLEEETPDGPVAVIDISGPIFPKANMMTELSGATSLETVRSAFREALANTDIKAILLNIDSPGGSVDLVPEFGSEILKARGEKPIVAVSNTWAMSAAYWIASAADELVVTPSGEVGSIGVYTAHDDISGLQEKAGVKTTLISAGKYKTEGNPFEPLTDEAQAEMQKSVDAFHEMFVGAVAKGRGVSKKDVLADFGQGRTFMAEEAVELGMADRVGTFDQTLTRLEKLGGGTSRRSRPPKEPQRTERRTMHLEGVEWRDSAASGEPKLIVRGHAAVFDRPSLDLGGFRERIAPGAFTEVLDSNPDVQLNWEHQQSLALARTRSSKYKLELREDPIGLHFYATVAPTSYAKDLRILMESDVVNQASFEFNTPDDGSGEHWGIVTDEDGEEYVERTITRVSELFAATIAGQPAFPHTDTRVVRSLRSRAQSQIDEGGLPERAAKLLDSVAPDDPAGEPTSQSDLGDGRQRSVAPDEVGADSSQNDLGEEERVSSAERERTLNEMAEAVAVAKEQKREFERRKYELKARKD
jgi:HK97 family phage prohead protease